MLLEKFRWHPGFHRRPFSKLSGEEGTIAKRWCYSYVNILVIWKFWIFHNPLSKKLIRKKYLPYSQSSDQILRVKHTNISWNNQYRISHAHFSYPLVSNLIEKTKLSVYDEVWYTHFSKYAEFGSGFHFLFYTGNTFFEQIWSKN